MYEKESAGSGQRPHAAKVPLRQRIRKMLLISALLLFPVTLYYFSPALVFNGALHHVINGSLIVFALMLVLSVPFGRLFCGWLCPGGGLQECLFAVNGRVPRQGWRNRIKYVIWAAWLAGMAACFVVSGRPTSVRFFYETFHGISVRDFQSYIIYYGILGLILLPAVFGGRRAFCHYLCWMAPFMAVGEKLRRHLPGVCITADRPEDCTACGRCERSCPMGLPVQAELRAGIIRSTECIQCGACADSCPKDILHFGFTTDQKGRKMENGERKGS